MNSTKSGSCKSYAFLKLVEENSDNISRQLLNLESIDFTFTPNHSPLEPTSSQLNIMAPIPLEASNNKIIHNAVEIEECNQELLQFPPPPMEALDGMFLDENFNNNVRELSKNDIDACEVEPVKAKLSFEKMSTFQKARRYFMTK